MRKLALIGVASIVFGALPILGQSASLTVPETYNSSTKIVVKTFYVDDTTQTAYVIVQYQDAGSATRREQRYDIPANPTSPGTEYVDFLGALGTAALNETGTTRRRANFRILTYLVTTYSRISGVTLTP